MAKNFKQPGEVMDWVNGTGAAVTSGSAVLIGARLGVALSDIANGATGSVQVSGVFSLPKLAADVFAQGAVAYWDSTNKRFTVTASGNTVGGYAFAVAGAATTSVDVKLNA